MKQYIVDGQAVRLSDEHAETINATPVDLDAEVEQRPPSSATKAEVVDWLIAHRGREPGDLDGLTVKELRALI